MTASELNRKLLFYGYDEVTDFLMNSPLNRHIYKQFLEILPVSQIEVPVVALFNEIYYQCVRVNYDCSPGVEIGQRYLAEEESWLLSQQATQLVFAVVWAILNNKREITFHEECFLSHLAPYIKNSEFSRFAKKLQEDFHFIRINIPNPFPVMTWPVQDLPVISLERIIKRFPNSPHVMLASLEGEGFEEKKKEWEEYHEAWREITTNFSHSAIEKYVRLYSTPDEQLLLIERIGRSLSGDEGYKHDRYLAKLIMDIKAGRFGLETNPSFKAPKSRDVTLYEFDESMHNLALDRAATDEELNKTEQLQRDCEALRNQLEEQRKMHEMEISRLMAKYTSQIEGLKAKLGKLPAQLPAPKEADAEEKENTEQELAFTVSEMAEFAIQQFNRAGGVDFTNMFYQLARRHNRIEERSCDMVDRIVPAILLRDAPHQNIDISTAGQVNINPNEVINNSTDDKE